MLITIDSMQGTNVKHILKVEFDMKDLMEAKVILGMEINRNKNNKYVLLYQGTYLDKVLCIYNMGLCRQVTHLYNREYNLQ